MSLLDALLRRLGYVKLAKHGLALSPAGTVVRASRWRSKDGHALPLPPAGALAEASSEQRAIKPAAAATGQPALPAPLPPAVDDKSEEREWTLAMKRAKARGDVTQVIPKQCPANDSAGASPAAPASPRTAAVVSPAPANRDPIIQRFTPPGSSLQRQVALMSSPPKRSSSPLPSAPVVSRRPPKATPAPLSHAATAAESPARSEPAAPIKGTAIRPPRAIMPLRWARPRGGK